MSNTPRWGNVPTIENLPRDLHIRYRPGRIEDFWNYPRDAALQRLIRGMISDRLATVLIFAADFSGGKTSAATYLGQWTSCLRWRELPLPCGECEACHIVRFGSNTLRGGFLELDPAWGTSDGVDAQIASGFSQHMVAAKGDINDVPTTNPRRRVMFLDEAQRLTPKTQDKLLKRVEKLRGGLVILATDNVAKIDGGLISRGTVYRFEHPTPEEAVPHLVRIAKSEGFGLETPAAQCIARACSGKPRDCLGLLQEAMGFGEGVITLDQVRAILDG